MVSRIDPPQMPPPSATPPRRAEETDTRQAILRHDPDHNRRKKDDDADVEQTDIYDDLTDVSIPALRGFLQGLLAQIDTAKNAPKTATTPTDDHIHRTPASPKAAAAMAAYQTRAGTTPPPPPPPVDTAPVSALEAATLNLDRAELLGIMRDLDKLESKGIHAISIERGDGFLSSIRTGIATALSS